MSFKKCKVVMLPTNEKAQLNNLCVGGINKEVFQLKTNNSLFNFNQFQDWNLQHLYITSDEEIKKGDFAYSIDSYVNKKRIITWDEMLRNDLVSSNKIITTTDNSLGLPKPSQQFIEKYIEEYNKGNIITDVLVEYNEISIRECQTCGNITNNWKCNCKSISFNIISTYNELKVNPKDNTITIKKVKDSWNRNEVISLIKEFDNSIRTVRESEIKYRNNWIETNL